MLAPEAFLAPPSLPTWCKASSRAVPARRKDGHDGAREARAAREFDLDFEVGASSGVIGRCPDFSTRYSMVACNVPRCFHVHPREEQIEAMARPPRRTSTRRAARLAGVTERLAWEHEADRFCDPSWLPLDWLNARGRICLDSLGSVPGNRSE